MAMGSMVPLPVRDADEADGAADAHGLQRLLERAHAPDLHDVVHADARRSAPGRSFPSPAWSA